MLAAMAAAYHSDRVVHADADTANHAWPMCHLHLASIIASMP